MTRTMFQGLTRRLLTASVPTRPTSSVRRLGLESLEQREVPAVISWIAPGGSGFVSDTSNWSSGTIPGAGDDVIFPAGNAGVVDNDIFFPAQLRWNSMTVQGKNYTFAGEDFYLENDGLTLTYATGTTTFSADLDFFYATEVTIAVQSANAKLNLNGGIDRGAKGTVVFDTAGDVVVNDRIRFWFDPVDLKNPLDDITVATAIIKRGTGTLTFAGNNDNDYDGLTTVEDGTLILNQNTTNAAIPGQLQIGDGIGLNGSAIVRQLRSNQIENPTTVSMSGDGLWDLSAGGFNETLGGIKSKDTGSEIRLGSSNLTLNSGVAVFNGAINGTTGSITVASGDQTFGGPISTTGSIQAAGTASGAIVEVQNVTSGGIGTGTGNGFTDTLFSTSTSASITIGATDLFFPAFRDSDGNLVPAVPQTGTLSLNASSETTILIASQAEFGSVIVTSGVVGASLGNLRVELPTAYVPNAGETFVIIDYRPGGGFPAQFAGLAEGDTFFDAAGNAEFRITYQGGDGNDVAITNTNPQRVTLNQASIQADPTTGNTTVFDAVFTGAVKTFDPTKIATSFTGTLKSTGISFIERSPNTYRVFVNGLTGSGTITMTLLAGAGESFADVLSLPSTSTDNSVTVVVTPSGGGGGGGGGGVVGPVAPGNGATNPGSGNVLLVGTGAGDNRINAYRGAATDFTQSRVTGPEFSGGVRVATADFNGDGFEDYVLGSGPGGTSTVRILDGRSGETLFNATPFELSFTGGVYVAAGDLNGDKIADLVVTADVGGGPRVVVFSGVGFKQVGDFFGIDDPNFRGGSRPAIGDIDGDGIGDLVIAAGFGGGPRIAGYFGPSVFGSTPTKLFQDFFAFEPTLTNGVFVAVGDINGDGFGDVIAGGGPGGGPRVSGFSGEQLIAGVRSTIANFFAGDPNNRGGIRLAVEDFQGDGIDDLITGSGDGAGTTVTVYPLNSLGLSATPPVLTAFDAFPDLLNGVFVG